MSAPEREQPVRPWWASADPDVDRLDPDEDPLDAVRSARRRTDHDDATTREHSGADGGAPSEPSDASCALDVSEVCGVCPVCAGWRYLRDHHPDVAAHLAAAGRHLSDAQPEVVEHLAAAGRHLAAVFRQVLEDRGEAEAADDESSESRSRPGSGARSRQAARDGFERIDLDDGQG